MVRDSSLPIADNISNSVSNGSGISSPHSRNRSLWASVVRRGDSDQNYSPSAPDSSPPAEHTSKNTVIKNSISEIQLKYFEDINGDINVGMPRRPAWNRLLNGVAAEPTSSVLGGVTSWPALSETTRPIIRSTSDVSRPVSDRSAALSQAPIISQTPQSLANNSCHSNSTGNNSNHGRPRSRNRGGGGNSGGGGGGGGSGGFSGGGPSQNTFNQPSLSMPPPFPVFEVPYRMLPVVHDNSFRGSRPIGGASQSHSSIENSSQRNNSRRVCYGTRPRGEHHNNHGRRREHDRNDAHHPPQYVPPPMGYMPPLPTGAGPFMPPPHVRVSLEQIRLDMPPPFCFVHTMPPESLRAMPIIPPLAPINFPPANEDQITIMIIKQIDFYFSDDNLVKDSFLRSNMDDEGWVPIGLIASFRRVQQLTKDIPLILESLRHSTVVEVQGDKVRKCNEWSKWLLSSGSVNSDSGSHNPTSTSDVLATSLQEVSLDDPASNRNGNNIDALKCHVEAPARIGDDCAEVHPMS